MNRPAVIRTPDQHLRVFISSTLKEQADEREAAFATAWSEGRLMTYEQVITYAIGESDRA